MSYLIKRKSKLYILLVLFLGINLNAEEPSITYSYDELNLQTEFNLDYINSNKQDSMSLQMLLNSAENNLSLQANELLIKQSKQDKLVANLANIPTLDLDYNFNHDLRGALNYTAQSAHAIANLNIFNGFANLNASREKQALIKKAISDASFTKQSIELQILGQYYGYFNNKSTLLSLEQKLNQISEDVKRVQNLYDQGLRTISDLEALKSQLKLTEYQIDNANLMLEDSKLMLEYLANTQITSLKRETLKDPIIKLEQREDIKALAYNIKSAYFLNKQLHYYPTINLKDTYTFNIQIPNYAQGILSSPQASPFFAANFATHQNTIQVLVSYKLFDKIGLSVQKQSIKLGILANEKLLAYKKQEQSKDEKLYRKALSLAKNQINSSLASYKSADISYQNIKKRYESNLITFTDYLQALSSKYDAWALYIQALNNYELQKANYIYYSGQKIQDYIQ